MSITDELRKYVADNRAIYMTPFAAKCLIGIADSIDAEHERAVRYERCAFWHDASDGELAKYGLLRAPIDADGELIRTGDMMQIKDCDGRWCGPFKVLYQVLTGAEWRIVFDAGDYAPKECRHYHAPTVEDVLEELLREYDRDDSELTNGEIVEMFAKRLTLAGDGR